MGIEIEPIATIRTSYDQKFGVPRQPGLVREALGMIEFAEPWRRAEVVQGLEGFSHVWLVFLFHEHLAKEQRGVTMVRPPRLGGNEKRGVFATRSPFRPNPIGLSLVELVEMRESGELVVRGVDVVDGTPLLDIKPYVAFADTPRDAAQVRCGFVDGEPPRMAVLWRCAVPAFAEDRWMQLVDETLSLDPRPAYQHDRDREYGCCIEGINVRWRVQGNVVHVLRVG